MNNNNNTAAANAVTEDVSEYKIGHTTYRVTVAFSSASKESLSDILKRLISNGALFLCPSSRHRTYFPRSVCYTIINDKRNLKKTVS